MKYPILTMVIAALSFCAPARGIQVDSLARKPYVSRFQLGLNVGAMYNSTFEGYRAQDVRWLKPNSPSALFAINGIYTTRNWRYGLSLERGGISYKIARTEMFGGPQTYIDEGKIPAYRTRLSFDRALTRGKAEVYCGATTGLLFWNESPTEKLWFSRGRGIVTAYTAGLQAGLTYRIDRVTHLNAQLGCDYVNTDFDFFTYSFTVGLRMTLFRKTHP